jgi:hypothetical protein
MSEKIIISEIVLTSTNTDTSVAAIMQQVASLIYTDVTA